MKLHYFAQKTADDDDIALGEAKVLGHVPEACLLGGVQVWKTIRTGLDPCVMCNGPRARCGGRYSVEEVNMVVGSSVPGEFEAALRAYGDAIK